MKPACAALCIALSGCNYSSFIESRPPPKPHQHVCEVRVIDKDSGRETCMSRRDVQRVLTGP